MESATIPEILQAAIEERYRLEVRLRSNPDFRRLEAVRRVIELYDVAEGSNQVSPIADSDLPGKLLRPESSRHPDLPTIIASSGTPTARNLPVNSRRGWTRKNSETSRIRAGAVEHLRKKGSRAPSTEIAKALASNGVKTKAKKRVAARLSASPLFDHADEGYGLSEWSNGGAPGS